MENTKLYVIAGMYCGKEGSDILDPEVYATREGARKAIMEAIVCNACAAELIDEDRNLIADDFGGHNRVKVIVQGKVNGETVIDDSLTSLSDTDMERVVPADVHHIILKDNDYDEYWMWEIHEKNVQ